MVEGALRASVYDRGVDHLYETIDDSRSAIVQPVLSGLVARTGEALGALAILVLTFGLDISLRTLLWLYLFVLLAWVGVELAIRRTAESSAALPAPDVIAAP